MALELDKGILMALPPQMVDMMGAGGPATRCQKS